MQLHKVRFRGIQVENLQAAADAEIQEAIRSCLQNGPLNKTSLVNAAKTVCSTGRNRVDYEIKRMIDRGVLTVSAGANNAKIISLV